MQMRDGLAAWIPCARRYFCSLSSLRYSASCYFIEGLWLFALRFCFGYDGTASVQLICWFKAFIWYSGVYYKHECRVLERDTGICLLTWIFFGFFDIAFGIVFGFSTVTPNGINNDSIVTWHRAAVSASALKGSFSWQSLNFTFQE